MSAPRYSASGAGGCGISDLLFNGHENYQAIIGTDNGDLCGRDIFSALRMDADGHMLCVKEEGAAMDCDGIFNEEEGNIEMCAHPQWTALMDLYYSCRMVSFINILSLCVNTKTRLVQSWSSCWDAKMVPNDGLRTARRRVPKILRRWLLCSRTVPTWKRALKWHVRANVSIVVSLVVASDMNEFHPQSSVLPTRWRGLSVIRSIYYSKNEVGADGATRPAAAAVRS